MNSNIIDLYWAQIREGDEEAFKNLFRELYSPLCRYSVQITGDNFLSEEIVQDVFQKLWESRDIIIISTSFKAYVFQSVRNHSINTSKKKASKKFSFSRPVVDKAWEFLTETYEYDDFIVERITADETEKQIEQVIDSLPPGSIQTESLRK